MKFQFVLNLKSLKAYLQSETSGDEILIKHNGEKIWPVEEKYFSANGSTIPVNIKLPIDKQGQTVELELWEYDNIFSSQCLGTFTLLADQTSREFTTDLKSKKEKQASYALSWEVSKTRV